ncbi:MAG: YggS family pyridoxal phosphate-dependent enzyme, partial [Desulfitobacterium hafniense]|nr:YggS family pyridoxal phosphate-dependent enzyme [Desulfitobacterium hafniense]
MNISENLKDLHSRIENAARSAGRNAEQVKLLAVSKTMTPDAIKEAYRAGQRFFAENRVQEWIEKVPVLPSDCEWHIVGRLQTNKVKYLDDRVKLIHSLDRFDLLREMERQGERKGLIWSALVQVNVSRDKAKAGFMKEEIEDFLSSISECAHVKVFGFMTIGELNATNEQTQGFFRELRELRDSLAAKNFPGVELRELSMGMSEDFELAIREGATMVRV